MHYLFTKPQETNCVSSASYAACEIHIATPRIKKNENVYIT
jgi:hypothetical protein